MSVRVPAVVDGSTRPLSLGCSKRNAGGLCCVDDVTLTNTYDIVDTIRIEVLFITN